MEKNARKNCQLPPIPVLVYASLARTINGMKITDFVQNKVKIPVIYCLLSDV